MDYNIKINIKESNKAYNKIIEKGYTPQGISDSFKKVYILSPKKELLQYNNYQEALKEITKQELKELLQDQKEYFLTIPYDNHPYYIEDFQYKLVDLLDNTLNDCDTLPNEFYITLDSLQYIDILVDDLMKYYDGGLN